MKSKLSALSREELLSIIYEELQTNEQFRSKLEKHFFNKNEQLNISTTIISEKKLEMHQNISKHSSPEEKIALFMELFKGRNDVFALRWESEKSKGYTPVCKNKWNKSKCDMKKYPCKICPNKEMAKLDEKYVYNHLVGKDELCRDVIGLYPLLQDDSCWFLALDFDEKNWKNDVLSVYKICKENEIPAYIEISRSGNGAHLWLFFSEKIPSIDARKLGYFILQSTMKINHSISISSFDRMFPNQDYLPKGGYGNLIALPLQGKSVKKGFSLFVDESFVPYNDQWQFLSTIKKMSNYELKNFTKHIPDEVYSENEKTKRIKSRIILPKIAKTFSSVDFPKKIKIILSNRVEICKKGFSEQALSYLKQMAVFQNPEFYKRQRIRLPIYNTPQFIDCSEYDEKYLILPRGCFSEVLEFFESNSCCFSIDDKRCEGNLIDVAFESELFSEQKDALKVLLQNDMGILSAGTGFGKTVIALSLIAERKVSTLIIVNSTTLLEQWKNAVKKFLQIEVGFLAGGKDNLTGKIDVALVQSFIDKKTKNIKTLNFQYGMIITDECHHISAFSYETVIKTFAAKYIYGLTATPNRRDNLEKIFFMRCGPILYSTTTKQMNKLQNFNHYFLPRFTTFHDNNYENQEEKTLSKYYSELVKNQARNQLIINDVKNTLKIGKTPLILSDRISHLEILKSELKDSAKNIFLITGKGTLKQKKEILQRLEFVSKDESLIILATGKYVGEGFDNPRLDTLFLAMPFSWKGTLAQYCGRIHRNYEGKSEVVIFDYVDLRIPVFDKMYQKRLKGYKQLDYEIKQNLDFKNEGADDFSSIEKATFFSYENFFSQYERDILLSKKSVLISSSYIKKSNLEKFLVLTSKKISEGVKFILITKICNEKDSLLISQARNSGITVIEREKLYQNLLTIDEKILWYGSCSPLGFFDETDCILRIEDSVITSEIESGLMEEK